MTNKSVLVLGEDALADAVCEVEAELDACA
jgi:hypothetical protein